MVEITSIVILGFINIALVLYLRYLTDKYNAMLKDLLNRLMSGNYNTYVQAELAQRQAEQVEEVDYEERGIPV